MQISQVQYDSPDRDKRSNHSLNGEWVDITNTTRRAVTSTDGRCRTATSTPTRSSHYRLDGRSTVRVHTGIGRDTRTDLYQDRRSYVWNNTSDTATLRDERGRIIDSFSWGGHHRSHR
ncbi:lamin tail domain-containing protein [Streptomyces sp. NPDC001795]|uniref:lamin tail domain-containing protein n=1 Tax=Streptomyces sp. NPDC001795 TaxID=3154525 RepID=UPI00332296FA